MVHTHSDTHTQSHTHTRTLTHNMSQHDNMVTCRMLLNRFFVSNRVVAMLSMVLLVLLLCFEPAKASLLEPAKAALLLGLLEPAKARPPLPWWRVRVWENSYWLCSPSGYMRELDDDEEEELEDIFDANGAAGKYVWQQSSECLAGNCWSVSWNQPEYWWHDYQPPAEAGTADYYQHWEDWSDWTPSQPAQGYSYSSSSQPAQGYGCHSSSSTQPAQGYQWPFNRPGQALRWQPYSQFH